jgi:DnaJ-domain-containing protein 1
MFDRLFNILKANLNNALEKDDFQAGDKTVDEIYAEYLRKVQEDENLNPPKTEFKHTHHGNHTNYTPPKSMWTQEEIEAFKTLEVAQGASFDQIKIAYKSLIKKYHPDKFHNEPSKYKTALELSQKINKAFDVLEKKYEKK